MPRPAKNTAPPIIPMLKTIEAMSKHSGIGENRLRSLIASGEIPFVQIGTKKLLADSAIWDWYERNKVTMDQEVG